MSAAARILAPLWLGIAVAACGQGEQDTANNAAVTEIEALPPDESVAAPTDEPANGSAEPDVNEPANSY